MNMMTRKGRDINQRVTAINNRGLFKFKIIHSKRHYMAWHRGMSKPLSHWYRHYEMAYWLDGFETAISKEPLTLSSFMTEHNKDIKKAGYQMGIWYMAYRERNAKQ